MIKFFYILISFIIYIFPHVSAILHSDIEKYLLSSDNYYEECGYPLSRPYLFKKFGLTLQADFSNLLPSAPIGTILSVRVFGAPGKTSCNSSDLDLWARVVGENEIIGARITPIEGVCEWNVEFLLNHVGLYELEIVNIWLRGAQDPVPDACEPKKRTIFIGKPVVDPLHYMGSPFISCCDKCSILEDCRAWSLNLSESKRSKACNLFSEVTGVQFASDFVSQYRVQSPLAQHLGGIFVHPTEGKYTIEKQNFFESSGCRQHAHIFGSPFKFYTTGSMTEAKFNTVKNKFCSTGHEVGRWVKSEWFDSTLVCNDDNKKHPGCLINELPYVFRPISLFQKGFEWQPYNCAYRLYDKESIKQCFIDKKYKFFIISGDSLILEQKMNFENILDIKHGSIKANVDGIQMEFLKVRLDLRTDTTSLLMACEARFGERLRNTPFILMSNFAITHREWHEPISEFRRLCEEYTAWFNSIRYRFHPDSKFIFFSPTAIHGFREPFCTLPRAKIFFKIVKETFGKNGWWILDAFSPTYLRPDGAGDGLHYAGGVSQYLTQIFLNMICNG